MNASIYNPRRMGSIYFEDVAHFRVWAPFAQKVSVVGDFNDWNPEAHVMRREDGGLWSLTTHEARAGHHYQYEIRNGDQVLRKNDPYVLDVDCHTKTGRIYTDDFPWQRKDFVLPSREELVIYELHVGTFATAGKSAPGQFDQIRQRLPYLRHLGINAIELMPLAAFPSERSWGYNLTNPFAVEESYGGPLAFKRLVDAAHAAGIGIIVDVVLNHFGPSDLDLWQFDGWSENGKGGIYFYNDHRSWTPWGENRPDYGRGEVRQYLRDSALFWLDYYRVDGLRFDSTLFIRNTRGDNSNPETDIPAGWSLLQWINEEVERFFPGKITIAEDLMCNEWITKGTGAGGAGFHAQWDAAFVHPVRATIVQVEDQYRSMDAVVHAVEVRYNDDPFQRVIYSESHDEVANGKARVPQEIDPNDTTGYFAQKRSVLAAGLALTAPGIPMLFEGQEFLADGWFRDDVTLDWSRLDAFRGINRLYRDLIHLRRNLHGNTRGLAGLHCHVFHVDHEGKVVAFRRWKEGGAKDEVIVVASFSNEERNHGYRIGLPQAGEWIVRFNSDWRGYSPDFADISNPEGKIIAEEQSCDGLPGSGTVTIPPYGLLILSQETA